MGSALAAAAHSKKSSSKGRTSTGKSAKTTARASKASQAMHKKHPAGHLTQAMLAASRANLVLARQALGETSATSSLAASVSTGIGGGVEMPQWVLNKVAWQTQIEGLLRPKGVKGVLGTSLLSYRSSLPSTLSTTKFQTGVSSGATNFTSATARRVGISRTGSWGTARTYRRRNRLYARSRRRSYVSGGRS